MLYHAWQLSPWFLLSEETHQPSLLLLAYLPSQVYLNGFNSGFEPHSPLLSFNPCLHLAMCLQASIYQRLSMGIMESSFERPEH